MKNIKRSILNMTATIVLAGLCGCTLIGIGVGAAVGYGSTVGMLGGAVIGGIIGHEIGD